MALPVEEVQGVRQDEQRIMTSYLFPGALRPAILGTAQSQFLRARILYLRLT